ncbi:hypothetical protein ACTXT7_011190 [Hymenolepis weldensis]
MLFWVCLMERAVSSHFVAVVFKADLHSGHIWTVGSTARWFIKNIESQIKRSTIFEYRMYDLTLTSETQIMKPEHYNDVSYYNMVNSVLPELKYIWSGGLVVIGIFLSTYSKSNNNKAKAKEAEKDIPKELASQRIIKKV